MHHYLTIIINYIYTKHTSFPPPAPPPTHLIPATIPTTPSDKSPLLITTISLYLHYTYLIPSILPSDKSPPALKNSPRANAWAAPTPAKQQPWETSAPWSRRCPSTKKSYLGIPCTFNWPRPAWRTTRAILTNCAKCNRLVPQSDYTSLY